MTTASTTTISPTTTKKKAASTLVEVASVVNVGPRAVATVGEADFEDEEFN
jgi:hypothetical protein